MGSEREWKDGREWEVAGIMKVEGEWEVKGSGIVEGEWEVEGSG